ncbi:uncharacterized protein LY79DRAFT_267417 [Colletotrichum navitas]|uniref:Uncharacterized protein n=1 Tax=Colletotrichum navitas TaxID=681940 RepID=A0AAD8PVT1_9PEZI|nr:uncharacterized protein LY79DRAFT_267417 [Colletotrichum navitas]KAK1585602.1 hypothetical protein LY79DRAFT_267417 [Colletotrichum navitas]
MVTATRLLTEVSYLVAHVILPFSDEQFYLIPFRDRIKASRPGYTSAKEGIFSSSPSLRSPIQLCRRPRALRGRQTVPRRLDCPFRVSLYPPRTALATFTGWPQRVGGQSRARSRLRSPDRRPYRGRALQSALSRTRFCESMKLISRIVARRPSAPGSVSIFHSMSRSFFHCSFQDRGYYLWKNSSLPSSRLLEDVIP